MVRDSLKGDFRSPCEIVSQRSELRIPLFFFMGISSNKSSPKVVVKKWWFTYGTKHKESPKSSDKSFPRCNNFAASEMRLRRAKALPTCENSRKKNRPPVGWWLKNSVILYSFYLETPNKKSGERKKHTWKINIYLKPTTYRRWIRAPLCKKNHNNKKIGLWKDGFRKDMMLKSFSCFFCKTCVLICWNQCGGI